MRAAAVLFLALRWCAAPSMAAALSRRLSQLRSNDDSGDVRDDLFDVDEDDEALEASDGRPWLHHSHRKVNLPEPAARSNANNTVVFMPTSTITGVKLMIIRELVRVSPYPIVIGYDTKDKGVVSAGSGSQASRAGAMRRSQEVEAFLTHAIQGSRAGATFVPISRSNLFSKYNASKIANYCGVYEDNPAKLAVMDWFNSSSYSYLWHLEDDTWPRGLAEVASESESSSVDLLIKNSSFLPFWAANNDSTWRIGDRGKLPKDEFFKHANPAVFRMSKKFARKVVQALQESNTTNHHELWFPYIVQRYKLSWSPLPHAENVHFNVHHNDDHETDTDCVSELETNESKWLVHPVKCGLLDGV